MSKFCQSCGIPMKKDPKNGGTEKNGEKTLEYCSYCYKNGEFSQKFSTAKEMQKFCIEKMVEINMFRFVAWILSRNIPYLKRWKNK